MHTYMHTHMHTYMHTHMHTYMHTHTQFYTYLVWPAGPSHLITGGLGLGWNGLAAAAISSHLIDQSDATGRNSC